MNPQKQRQLFRLFQYFKSKKEELSFPNKRNICLPALDGACWTMQRSSREAVFITFPPDGN